MFTKTKSLGSSAIVLGAIGLLAQNTVFAQTHRAQQADAMLAIVAGDQSRQGTGHGVWVHPTGPTGSFYGELYDTSGNLRFLMEGGLTKAPGFESMDLPQFGYMDGNLYSATSFGPLMLVARIEGQWEKAPNANGRFLAEIVEATEVADPQGLGLIEGGFKFQQAPADAQRHEDGSPYALIQIDGAGANRAVRLASTGDDDSQDSTRKHRVKSKSAMKSARQQELESVNIRRLEDLRSAAQRRRDSVAGTFGTGIDPGAQPGPTSTDQSEGVGELPVEEGDGGSIDRVEGIFTLRWSFYPSPS